jgi:hypothetical protein
MYNRIGELESAPERHADANKSSHVLYNIFAATQGSWSRVALWRAGQE